MKGTGTEFNLAKRVLNFSIVIAIDMRVDGGECESRVGGAGGSWDDLVDGKQYPHCH